MRRAFPFIALFVLLLTGLVYAQGAGFFVRSDCTTITNPVAFQTGCLDSTKQRLRVWDGSAWQVFSLAPSMINGQVMIGSSGADPVAGTLTAGPGVTVTNAAGKITLTASTAGHGQGRLTLSSATLIQFCPYNGQNITINGVAQSIPSACVTAANTNIVLSGTSGSNLAASTTYFVYVFMSSGTMTIDFSTTTHKTDTTAGNIGVEVINATDATTCTAVSLCTLIGMVRTNGSSQFEADASLQGVLSWFNRRDIGLVNNFTADRTTSSTTYVELNSEIRGNFLTWSDEAVIVEANFLSSNNTAPNITSTSIGFDGTNQENAVSSNEVATAGAIIGENLGLVKNGLAEGFHFVTLLGTVNATTGTWNGGTYTADTIRRRISSLSVKIRG